MFDYASARGPVPVRVQTVAFTMSLHPPRLVRRRLAASGPVDPSHLRRHAAKMAG
jgi:hypothetical protein